MSKPVKTIFIWLDDSLVSIKPTWESYAALRDITSDPETNKRLLYTHNTDFFCFDTLEKGWNVVAKNSRGSVDLYDLLNSQDMYCEKFIRRSRNAPRKLLLAGVLEFK